MPRATFTDNSGITIVLGEETSKGTILSKLDGWYGVEVRSPDSVARLGDGVFPRHLWRTERKITLAGITVGLSDTEAWSFSRQISSLFQSGTDRSGLLTVTDRPGTTLTAGVQLDGAPKVALLPEYGWVRWELPLVAPDPYLYGEPVQSQAFVQGTGTGLIYPLFDDAEGNTTNVLEFGDEQPPPATLINTGNAVAYPVVTVTGDMRSGFILSLSGDKDDPGPWRIAWQTDTRPYSPVTVDFSGSVTVDGVDQSWALTERGWGGVRPGGAVSFSISPIAAGSGSALMTLRPTFL